MASQFINLDGLEVCAGNKVDPEWETTRDVARRSVGGFAGWSQPNDLFSKVMHDWDLYTCCSAQGVRGLFNAWTNAVTEEDDVIRVNLLINSKSKIATVRSWLPNCGRLEIIANKGVNVQIRIPSWLDQRALEIKVNGKSQEPSFLKPTFAEITDISAGSQIVCLFPITENKAKESVLGTEYTISWSGDTVTGVSPAGSRVPLYGDNGSDLRSIKIVEKVQSIVRFGL